MNGNDFALAADGWTQVTPCGEFPHAGAGVTQVVDREACDRIAAEFGGRKADPNFPGVLVDFDHFSLDTDKSSEAAGWITELEARDTGLWARVRWSDSGLAAVQGGRFRLVSPVFPAPDACEDLGGGRIRPVKLVSVALTNEPNIKGGRPLANRQLGMRSQELGIGEDSSRKGARTQSVEDGGRKTEDGGRKPVGNVMSGPGAKKFMWLLGDPPKGPHCGECASRNGQVKTLLEWLRMPAPMCHCYCRLAEVGKDVPEGYKPEDGGRKAEDGGLANRWSDAARAAARASRKANGNYAGWSDAARAASLAARRAHADSGGVESLQERLQRKLHDDLVSASYGVPEGYTGPSIAAGAPERREAEAALEDTAPTLRELVGAVPASGYPLLDGLTAAIGAAATFGPAVSAAGGSGGGYGAASRAYGGRGTSGAPAARRGRAAEWFRAVAGAKRAPAVMTPDVEADLAVETAKANLRQRQQAERDALADAIRRIRGGSSGDGLEMLTARQLRDILKAAGGDPGPVRSANAPDPSAADAARKSPKFREQAEQTAGEARAAREAFAQYLRETVPPRAQGVDRHIHELDTLAESAGRETAKAKEALIAAQAALRGKSPGTPEYEEAARGARMARFDLEFAARAAESYLREAAQLRLSVDSYLKGVREGNPLNWTAEDADYERIWRRAHAGPEDFYGGALGNRRPGGMTGEVVTEEGTMKVTDADLDSGRRVPAANRWSDAARASARASRKANGNYAGWSDAARAAALAVRRAKAAARAGTYADGTPVIRDITATVAGRAETYDPELSYIGDGDAVARRQADYAESLRRWWEGVQTTAGNIERFNAFVAAFGGAAAAAAGAPNPAGAASSLFGAKYGGQKPVYDSSGNVVGWAKVSARPAAARRRARTEPEGYTSDPLNHPKTPADAAVRESYGRHLDALRRVHEKEMAAKGLDPQGYPLSRPLPQGVAPPAVTEALTLIEALKAMEPRTSAEREAYEAAREGLRRFTDLYERDMEERAAREGILSKVREAVDAYSRLRGNGGAARESAEGYTGEELPWFAAPVGVKESAVPYGKVSAGAAREAARALGVLHGAYGVGEEGTAIPEALRGEYELGRAEGAKGYDYGITPPKDRAAVLRGAQAYLEGALGEDEGYAPDHLNDRYNLADWDKASSWATRNQGKSAVYDPRTPDTRGQYSPAGLMRAAMGWFSDAMVRGDRGASNAALSYMGDLLATVAAERRSAGDAGGGREEAAEDGEEAEIDASMPEYDADGNELGGEPFFEDSYADPAALPPWWRLLGNRWSDAARAAARASRKANGWGGGWSDAARAASLAVRRAKAALRQAQGKAVQAAGPVNQPPLAHPGWPDNGESMDSYLKRKRRREANEARKAADNARLREEREERRRRRGSSLSEASG